MSDTRAAAVRQDGIQQDVTPHKGGAFDVRNVIAALIGFYGIVLIIMGIVADSAQQLAKTGGVNANLWAGIVMTVIAAVFIVWARLRPVVLDAYPDSAGDRSPH
jgi:hypothetical protein